MVEYVFCALETIWLYPKDYGNFPFRISCNTLFLIYLLLMEEKFLWYRILIRQNQSFWSDDVRKPITMLIILLIRSRNWINKLRKKSRDTWRLYRNRQEEIIHRELKRHGVKQKFSAWLKPSTCFLPALKKGKHLGSINRKICHMWNSCKNIFTGSKHQKYINFMFKFSVNNLPVNLTLKNH